MDASSSEEGTCPDYAERYRLLLEKWAEIRTPAGLEHRVDVPRLVRRAMADAAADEAKRVTGPDEAAFVVRCRQRLNHRLRETVQFSRPSPSHRRAGRAADARMTEGPFGDLLRRYDTALAL